MPKLDPTTEALVQAARQFFPSYMALVHHTDMPQVDGGLALPAQHHMEMMAALTQQTGNTLIVMPRGAAKTTVVQAFIEWSFGRKSLSGEKQWARNFRVLYLSHAAHRAYAVSLAVMQTIEGNDVYKTCFPGVLPSVRKWSEAEWRLKGNDGQAHANFQAGGIDSPPLGGRFDLIVLDDIADEKNMDTPLQREKVRTTLNQTVMPMLVPPELGGRVIMAATRWAWDDPCQWALDRNWHHVGRKAIETDDEGEEHSYWPERFSLAFLRKLREEDARSFAKQYQNEVAPEEGLIFEKWWFQRRFDLAPTDLLCSFESWDLAEGTGKKHDYSVGICFDVPLRCPMCQDQPYHAFVTHVFRGKLSLGYLKMAIADVYRMRGGPRHGHYAVIEKKSAGSAILAEGIPGVSLKARTAVGEGQAKGMKEKRIAEVAHICREGRIHLPSDAFLQRQHESWLPDVERELFSYPDGQHDDVVAALVQGGEELEELRIRMSRLLNAPQVLRYPAQQRQRAII